jgi:hypothetical protein
VSDRGSPPAPPEASAAPPWSSTPPPPATRRLPVFVLGAVSVLIVVIAGLLVVRSVRPERTAGRRTIALAFTEGQTSSYRLSMSWDGTMSSGSLGDQPMKLDLGETITWTVIAVSSDGVATIRAEISDVTGSVNGLSMPEGSSSIPPITMRIAPDGRVLDAGGLAFGSEGASSGLGLPGMGQVTPLLPERSVSPGDTWDTHFSQPNPFGRGAFTYEAHSTLEGYQDVHGVRAARIRSDLRMPFDFDVALAEVLDAMGTAPTGATGLADLRDATFHYRGSGAFAQTAWVDLEAKQMLKTDSAGSVDMRISLTGLPEIGDDEIAFRGDFTQAMEQL